MSVGLRDLHGHLLIYVMTERRLDERIRVTDELVLDSVSRVMEHAVDSPAASAQRLRGAGSSAV